MPCEQCPHCQAQTAPDPVADLRRWCIENGHTVSGYDRVREETLAAIVGRSVGTVRNWALYDPQIPFTTIRSRRLYALPDVAAYLAAK